MRTELIPGVYRLKQKTRMGHYGETRMQTLDPSELIMITRKATKNEFIAIWPKSADLFLTTYQPYVALYDGSLYVVCFAERSHFDSFLEVP